MNFPKGGLEAVRPRGGGRRGDRCAEGAEAGRASAVQAAKKEFTSLEKKHITATPKV